MKRLTKALSMLLAIIMVVGLLPLSIIAEDIQNTHTVQFKLNYNGAHKIPSQKVADGECAVQPDDVTREGWIFEYWYVKTGNNGIQKFDLSQPITEDVTLYARWDEDITYWGSIWNRNILGAIADGKDDENTYTVTFDANGSDVENLPAAQTVKAGECAVEPADPTKLIHEFGGWYTDSMCTDRFSFDTKITSDITLYAKWEVSIYIKETETEHIKQGMFEYNGLSHTVLYADNQLFIVIDENVGREYVQQLIKPYGGIIVGQIPKPGYYQVELNNSYDIDTIKTIIDELLQKDYVEDAFINLILYGNLDTNNNNSTYTQTWFPNDNYDMSYEDIHEQFYYIWRSSNTYNKTWGLRAANVPQAWGLASTYGSPVDTRITVIDNTFDTSHSDLDIVVGIEDEGSSIDIDHGTHVAGIIGAKTNNEIGTAGISRISTLCGLPTGKKIELSEYVAYIAAGIELESKVINASIGWEYGFGTDLYINYYADKLADIFDYYIDGAYDFLVVVSAGNQGENSHDTNFNNPVTALTKTNYRDHILVVGNTQIVDFDTYQRHSESSYAGGRVDIMAPGTDIFSLYMNNSYGYLSGTSMAAPFVAGVAALIKENVNSLSMPTIREIILSTANIYVNDSSVNMINAEAAMSEALKRVGISTTKEDDTRTVQFRFVDKSNNGILKSSNIYLYTGGYAGPGDYAEEGSEEEFKLTHVVALNGDEGYSKIDTLYLNDGIYELQFFNDEYGYNSGIIYLNVTESTNVVYIDLSSGSTTPPAPETGYTVTGRLVSSADSSPIAGMAVTLGNNSNTYYATTDSNGYFEFTNVAAATSYALETGDGINFAFYKDTDVSVSQNTDLGTIQLTPSDTKTMRLRFVDSESKESLKISAIFENSSYVGIGHSGLDEGSEFIAGDFIDGRDGTNAFTVNNDSELVFVNVPVFGDEIWGNYYILFDSAEKEYIFPDKYTIASLDLVENTSSEWEVDVELVKTYLCVDGITVSNENASDILGDGSAVYNFDTKTLTLTNATLKNGDTGIDTNILGFNLVIPEGTTTYTKNAHSSIDAKRGVTISGSGVLYLGNSPDYYTVFNNYGSGDLRIKNTEIILDGSTGGIYCDNLVLDNASLTNTGVYGYSEFVNANSISIRNSTVDITSIGSNILWSHGGDININNSDVTLYCVDDELYSGYLLFAESASINIDNTSTVNLVAPYAGMDEDHELLCATNGIILGSGLSIRNSAGKTCEIYQAGEGWNYSVRCTDGTYPNQIFVAMPGEAVPGIETVIIPDRITITDVDYTWSAYVQGGGGKFTLDGNFKLFGDYRPTVTTTWGDTATVENTSGKEYEFTIDVWDEWYNSDMNDGDTLGKIIISAGNKSKEITVVINGTFDVSFSY